jgi:hypothetical protein
MISVIHFTFKFRLKNIFFFFSFTLPSSFLPFFFLCKESLKKLGMMGHPVIPAPQQAKAGGSRAPGQPGLHRETMFQKHKEK